jgi:hypothetical protein
MAFFKLCADLYGVTGTMGNATEKAEMPTFRPLVIRGLG